MGAAVEDLKLLDEFALWMLTPPALSMVGKVPQVDVADQLFPGFLTEWCKVQIVIVISTLCS